MVQFPDQKVLAKLSKKVHAEAPKAMVWKTVSCDSQVMQGKIGKAWPSPRTATATPKGIARPLGQKMVASSAHQAVKSVQLILGEASYIPIVVVKLFGINIVCGYNFYFILKHGEYRNIISWTQAFRSQRGITI